MSKKSILIFTVVLALCLTMLLGACQKPVPYTLTFNTNGGTEVASMTFYEGDALTAPTSEKAMFTFGGWYSDSALKNPFESFDSMPKGDLTLYARWIPSESTLIHFNSNGGSAVTSISGAVGSEAKAPSDPSKRGYSFAGWYSDELLTTPYVFAVFPQSDITVYAKWTEDTETYAKVTTVVNGNETEYFVEKGEKFVQPDAGDGFVASWYTDELYTTLYDFDGAVNQPLTLYGLVESEGLVFDGGTVVGYNGSNPVVKIATVHNGETVTAIGDSAFWGNTSLTSVELPDTVTSIGFAAFYKCAYLASINVTDKIQTIGASAFADCYRLAVKLDIGGVDYINANSFANCYLLPEVRFADDLTYVGSYAFANCSNLAAAELPDSVETVMNYAFADSGIKTFRIPATMVNFGTGALKNCSLTNIQGSSNTTYIVRQGSMFTGSSLVVYVDSQYTDYTLPKGITSVQAFAFSSADKLETLDISNAQNIAFNALSGMDSLTTLTFNGLDKDNPYLAYWFGATDAVSNTTESLYVSRTLTEVTDLSQPQSVGDFAYYGCRNLKVINGYENVTDIGRQAFAFTGITQFEIGENLASVGANAFIGCYDLEKFIVDENNSSFTENQGGLYSKQLDTLYSVASVLKEVQLPEQLKTVKEGAFYGSSVMELTLPDTFEQFEKGALKNANSLKKLTVPFIGASADADRYMIYIFGGTATPASNGGITINGIAPYSLTEIVLTEPVAEIPFAAFANCVSLKSLTNDVDLNTIGDFAFYNTAFEEIVIDDTVTSIGNYAFYQGVYTSVKIGSGTENVGKLAFANTKTLESIVFSGGESDLTVGDGAFLPASVSIDSSTTAYVSPLQQLVLSDNIVSIGQSAFTYVGNYYDESSGETTVYPFELTFDVANSRLKRVGVASFAFATVTSVTLPASIESVGSIAFGGCQLLETVTFGSAENNADSLTMLEDGAFGEVPFLKNVYIYKAVTSAEQVPSLGSGTGTGSVKDMPVFYGTTAQIYVPAGSGNIYRSEWSSIAGFIAEMA